MQNAVVLVIESEALIRLSAVHIVEDAGFSALEAWNAEDALEILDSRKDVRAVFTDINMSGSMDGLRLAHAIRGRWPPIHLLLASGLTTRGELPANGRFLPKPYTPEQVAAALHELFDLNPVPRRFVGGGHRKCGKVA